MTTEFSVSAKSKTIFYKKGNILEKKSYYNNDHWNLHFISIKYKNNELFIFHM